MRPETDLKGKVAVITGGGSGIGLSVALRAAAEGMKVALADADEDLLSITLNDTFGTPGTAAYVAAMRAIVGISESLYRELDSIGSQVGVTVVSPPLTNTNVIHPMPDRYSARKLARGARPGEFAHQDTPTPIHSDDKLAGEIFAAVTGRSFWLFVRPHPLPEVPSERFEAAEGAVRDEEEVRQLRGVAVQRTWPAWVRFGSHRTREHFRQVDSRHSYPP